MSEIRLPSIEFALGTAYNECSIASATCNYIVNQKMQNADNTLNRSLYYANPDSPRPYLQDFEFVPLTKTLTLDDGRPVSTGLARRSKTESPELLVIARDKIAFPLASFRRREGELCDYVQIGDEMRGGESVVTQNDEQNRRKTIDLIRGAVEVDSLVIKYAEVFEEVDPLAAAELQKDIGSDLRKRHKLSFGNNLAYALLMDASALNPDGCLISGYVGRFYGEKVLNKINSQAALPLEKVGRRFPNSHNPVIKQLLMRKALEYRDLSKEVIDTAQNSSLRLIQDTEVSQHIDSRLGIFDKRTEAVTSFVGKLAVSGEKVGIVVEEFPISNSTTPAEIIISARNSDKTGSFMMDVSTRLVVMDRAEPVWQSYNVDNLGPNPLSDAQLKEAADVIQVVTGKELPI